MKGRTPSSTERAYMDRVASIGCIACRIDGHYTPEVSIHHIDGRTKPGAHFRIIPLCAHHHQDSPEGREKGFIAVHPWKAQFEAMYGKQECLLRQVNEMLSR